MSAKTRNLWKDQSGAVMIEFTVAALVFFLMVFGAVEFANVFYQWNAATKAVQWGARVAAVSDPVSSDLATLTGVGGAVLPGYPMPAFDRVCTATNASGSTGTCTNSGTYRAGAMQAIVYGRDAAGTAYTICQASPTNIGMCNLFSNITSAANVVVEYQYTGLGYAGRPGGPVPTITVSLHQRATPTTVDANVLQFQFILIGGLMKIGNAAFPDFIDLPSFATTVTGEDLASAGS